VDDGWKGSRGGREKRYGAFSIPAKAQISSRRVGVLEGLVGSEGEPEESLELLPRKNRRNGQRKDGMMQWCLTRCADSGEKEVGIPDG
jgi:hypothetical protein